MENGAMWTSPKIRYLSRSSYRCFLYVWFSFSLKKQRKNWEVNTYTHIHERETFEVWRKSWAFWIKTQIRTQQTWENSRTSWGPTNSRDLKCLAINMEPSLLKQSLQSPDKINAAWKLKNWSLLATLTLAHAGRIPARWYEESPRARSKTEHLRKQNLRHRLIFEGDSRQAVHCHQLKHPRVDCFTNGWSCLRCLTITILNLHF